MISVHLPDVNWILTCDGVVLEIFYGDRSERIHIAHLESIQIAPDGMGNRALQIKTVKGDSPSLPVAQKAEAKVKEFVSDVQRAKRIFTF